MILKVLFTLALVAGTMGSARLWAVQLSTQEEETAKEIAGELGMTVVGKVFDDVFLLRYKSDSEGIHLNSENRKLEHPLIIWSEQQTVHKRISRYEKVEVSETNESTSANHTKAKMSTVRRGHRNRTSVLGRPTRNVGGLDRKPLQSPWSFQRSRDPLRWRQWYLGPGSGMYLNVTGLWAAGIRGGGISVAILDDGVESTHLDLALNYDPAASWDLLDADPDPMPVSWSRHGTQLAGIIAATHFNGMCGIGVAPWSGVGAVRMLGYVVYDAVEAAALSYERDHVDVYVAAWGPVDTGAVMEGPGILASRALRESIALGRNGLGSIYVWASGNGGYVGDDCNADGYSNSVYTLTVSGSTKRGRAPNYAETCAATFVSTYSGDADEEFDSERQVHGVVTTDLGGVCTDSFRGSSVSAAFVAGACALALDVNRGLGWRDMQHLMVQAAIPHNPLPSQWNRNGVGRMYSHYFGYGSLNAGKMVDLARKWKNVPPAFRCHAHSPHTNITLVPDQTLVIPISITGCQIVQAEHIQVNITLSADNRGQIEIVLKSPSGTSSRLLPQRPLDLSPYGIQKHPFLSVHMWGEDPRGIWKIYITYHSSDILEAFGGKRYVTTPNMLHSCSLIAHGTEVPIDEATLHNYHYNKTQLEEAIRVRNTSHQRSRHEDSGPQETKRENYNNDFRIEVEHWISDSNSTNDTLLHLFCRVMTSLPDGVSSIEWVNSMNYSLDDVVRHLRGQGPRAAKYPALLAIRKAENVTGIFTCKVTFNGNTVIKKLEVNSNYSAVPKKMETVQVAVEGENVTLPCENLSPILRGMWTKDDEHLNITSRMIINEDQLIIRDFQAEDAGVYECHKNAPRLYYSHKSSITLLMANGPSTLINYYAIDSHPAIPAASPTTQCSSAQDSNDLDTEEAVSISFTEDSLKVTQKQCPPPYRPIEGHCLLIGAGPARPWHQARQQCQKRRGELLVIHEASLMLALLQLLHTQGLASRSFWVGGLREDVGAWRWVDGIPMPMAAPFWFLTPTLQPQEVPIIQRNNERSLHEDFSSRRDVFGPERGLYMRSTGSQASHTSPSLLRRLGIQESSFSARRRQLRRRRRRRKRNQNSERLTGSPARTRLRASSGRRITAVKPRNDSRRTSLPRNRFAGDSSTRRPPGDSKGSTRATPIDTLKPSVSVKTRNKLKLRRERPRKRFTQAGQTRSGRPRTTEGELHPRDIYGQRAACMWAGLRHFFGSCSVLERLSALCEYKES